MKLKQMNALKATLEYLMKKCSNGILIYGEDTYNKRWFVQPINIAKAKLQLLSCSNIEIKGIGHYSKVEAEIVGWLKVNIRLPNGRSWMNMVSPHNWLRYNIASDLNIMHLSIANKHYYMCMREEYVQYYRRHLK